MNKVDLKKIIKPLIKECLQEVLVEEGFIKLVKESLDIKPIKQQPKLSYEEKEKQFIQNNNSNEDKKISLQEAKKKLLKEIGMTGFDPFAGSLPLQSEEDGQEDLQEDIDPQNKILKGINGRGVDISRLVGQNKQAWNFYKDALEKGKKE